MPVLSSFLASVEGRYINVDNSSGDQCWDLSQAWLQYCEGPGATLYTTGPGVPANVAYWAGGAWYAAHADSPQGAALRQHVTAIPGDQHGQPGDIVIWGISPTYPASHTAVLIEDQGGLLYCMSQNSSRARPDLPGYEQGDQGPCIRQQLPRGGILGFLRPKSMGGDDGRQLLIPGVPDLYY